MSESAHKKAWEQLRSLFLGLPLAVRILAVAIVAGTAALVGTMMHPFSQGGDSAFLMGGQEFDNRTLQTVCRALDAEGLSNYHVEAGRIRVPREQVQQYTGALSKREVLPHGFYAAFDKAAEQASWLSSSSQDDRRWQLAKQKSLAQIIEQMPEVDTASVLIDRGQKRGFRSEVEARATVTIKTRPGRELQPFRVRQIRNLVAGADATLPPENVAVVDLNGRTLLELGTTSSASDDLLVRMKEFEEHFSWKIRNVLSYLTDVIVTVNVELETTRQRHTEHLLVAAPEEATAVSVARAEQDDVPTVTANAAVELDTNPDVQPVTEAKTTQQTWEEHVALGPKSVTVAIAVPQDVVAAWQSTTQPGVSATWDEQIRQRVASAIPAGIPAKISVESFPRPVDRHLVTETNVKTSQGSLAPVSFLVLTASLLLGPLLALGGLRWHLARTRGEASARRRDTRDPISGSGSATTRELVRVERGVGQSRRGPHLIQTTINSFEDLRWLAPSSLQAVLGAVDSRLWAPALRGASRELCERILTHLPARAAVLLRDEIEFPGPVRLGDVETAQQEILEIVRRLDHTGDLMLEDREEIRNE